MSCWVVPSLAAEIWQIPLHDLMKRIREGEIAVRVEDDFTFVDVAPHGPRIERPNLPPEQRPATWTVANEPTPAQDAALTAEESTALSPDFAGDDQDELGPADDTQSTVLGDWRHARKKASRQRIPPPPRRLSA